MKKSIQQSESGDYTDKGVSTSDLKIEDKWNFKRVEDTPFAIGVDRERGPIAVIGNYIVYIGKSLEEVEEEIAKVNWHLILNAVIAYNNVVYEVNKKEE